ncbi:protein BIG GRAIN 1-like E [Cucurbita moschata]|uniref:Protein BIG GRAIN 1-like E n=1 Tax=Cucurbita moschata TaxID=3662 RepID=A0A6J1GXU5_CUCMO|nr:protein BIG GRAIN 1-like E [Cucurbita moschata]
MSVTSQLSGKPNKIFNKSLHRRKDSGELDVFEAARYFSGYNELHYNAAAAAASYDTSLFSQKIFREDDGGWRGGRMSLDLPIRTNIVPLPQPEKQTTKDQKKHRQQPSSPGGRLANFLNSLFNQSASKKKKKPKNPIKSEDLHENGGRKRRSSLSTLIDSKSSSIYSSSNISGFRTPPAPNCTVQTPNKNYKEIRSLLDQKRTSSKNLGSGYHKQNQYDIRKMNGVDEGAESDSSSDLFELRICDSDCGLPVYESTNIQTINRPDFIQSYPSMNKL